MTRLAPLAAIACLALPAGAQADDADRAAAALLEIEERMTAFFVSVDPDFGPVMKSIETSPDFRPALTCFIDTLRDSLGQDGLDEVLAAYETMAAREITSLTSMTDDPPEAMLGDELLAATFDCGLADLSGQTAMNEDVMAIMMRPGVMEALSGE
ncbi:MAG: hypothetical protein ACU0BF_05500 [Paracoccaceae bacterium]